MSRNQKRSKLTKMRKIQKVKMSKKPKKPKQPKEQKSQQNQKSHKTITSWDIKKASIAKTLKKPNRQNAKTFEKVKKARYA